MDSKYQITILSLLIIIVSFSVYFSLFSTPLDLEDKLILNKTQKENTQNINTSDNILEIPKQTEYTYEEALISGDVLNCKLIKEIQMQTLCESKLGVCNTDDCTYSKALETSNRDKCYEIKDEELKLKCSFETFKTNIFDSAVLENNINLCNEIQEENLNQRCKDNFYFVNSLNLNDISFCDKIVQSDLKEACYNEN